MVRCCLRPCVVVVGDYGWWPLAVARGVRQFHVYSIQFNNFIPTFTYMYMYYNRHENKNTLNVETENERSKKAYI